MRVCDGTKRRAAVATTTEKGATRAAWAFVARMTGGDAGVRRRQGSPPARTPALGPPTVLFGSPAERISPHYCRYLANQFRAAFPLGVGARCASSSARGSARSAVSGLWMVDRGNRMIERWLR